jgi:predicted nucleotidyltransferase
MDLERSDIIEFLKEIKLELTDEGIETLGLFGSFARAQAGTYRFMFNSRVI